MDETSTIRLKITCNISIDSVKFYVPLDTDYVILEMFFPANLLTCY